MRKPSPECEIEWREVQAVLDDEIQRLPPICREVFVLCCLENNSRAEVARRLGVKEGTVGSRVLKARALLQHALSRRGISLSALLAAGALAGNTVAAAVAPSLVLSTVRVATSIARESAAAGTRRHLHCNQPRPGGRLTKRQRNRESSRLPIATVIPFQQAPWPAWEPCECVWAA